jgi:uncharacterized repeat protein (TIGR02543 family)
MNPSYTITFNKNDVNATGTTAPQNIVSGLSANLTLNGFSKTGEFFAGWATTQTGVVAYTDGQSYTMGAANVTLYAIWTTNPSYTITFNKNDVNATGTMTNQSIVSGLSANLTLNAFQKAGWNFAGWATTQTGVVAYTDGQSYTMGAANVTLYAKWTANPFSVAFDKNDIAATGTMAAQSIASGSSANLTANAFQKAGWNFAGWATSSTGAVAYADGASYTMGVANVILYAKWTLIPSYTITFDKNDAAATGTMSQQSIVSGLSATLTTNSFVKTGWSFAGWATSSTGAVAYANGASYTMGAANVTLYAKWTLIPSYTITFDKNDAAATGTMLQQSIASGSSANLTANAFQKAGWTFAGWATTPGGAVAYANGASYTMGTTGVTLYAVWAVSPPTISTQPKDQAKLLDSAAIFSVIASGSNLSYQWQKSNNGGFSNVTGSGSTTAIFSILKVTSADAGIYRCLVSNTGGTVNSNSATLTVGLAPPIISLQPASQPVKIGAAATFTITATGSGALTYQWQKGINNVFTDVTVGAGAKTYQYTTPATVVADDQSKYQCVVYNSAGGLQTSATSSAATLTVVTTPVISTQPGNVTVIVGNTATFTIKATGYNLSYQWLKNGTAISNATSAGYTTPQLVLADNNTKFNCTVTNINGSVSSNDAWLYVNPPAPVITAGPGNKSAVEGTKAIFQVIASGTGLSYQWYKTDKAISGATFAACTTTTLTMADNGSTFKCVVSNAGGSATSGTATLTVALAPPAITVQPISQSAPPGNSVNFSITVTGSNIAYQWQKNAVNVTTGGTAASYITPAVTSGDNGAKFRCIVSNTSGKDTSVDAVLTVNALAPVITRYPTDQVATEGAKAVFTISATGSNLGFQWKKNDTVITNATDSIYTTPATTMADNGARFICIVSNPSGSVYSNTVILTVNMAPPVITIQPGNQSASEGGSVSFSVTATGTNCSYQWQKNDTNIVGATSASYSSPPATLGDNGAKFRCIVSNAGGNATSNEALLLVSTAAPVIVADPANVSVSEGSPASFAVSVSGSNLTYQWQRNGAPISTNATDLTYTIPVTNYADNGALFQCIITNSGGKATSASAKLTVVIAAPQISVQPQSQSAKVGTIVNFSVTATGSNLNYQWQKNNVAIATATGSSYSTPAVALADNGATFKCIVGNGAGSVTSNQATLTISATAPSITTQPASQTASAGQTASFTIVASGANLTYQWQKNGIDIPNAAAASFTTPPLLRADSGAAFRCAVTNAGGSIFSNQAILSVNTPQFTLSIGSSGNGLTSPDGKVSVYYGDSLRIKAIALQYYRFDHWQTDSGSVLIFDSTNADTRVISTKGNAAISAYFTLSSCTLSVASAGGGRVVPNGRVTTSIGSPTLVKAIADSGYRFDHWSAIKGNPFIADSTNDSSFVALLGNGEIRAMFSGALCTLTVKMALPPDSAKTLFDTLIIPGDTVPLIAPTMVGTAFIAWRVAGGLATIIDSSSASTKMVLKSGRVSVVAVFGSTGIVRVSQRIAPARFAMRFQRTTGVLYFDVPRTAGRQFVAIRIRLLDASGRLLREISEPAVGPGYYHVTLTGGHGTAARLSSMVDICVMESEGFKKAVIIGSVR